MAPSLGYDIAKGGKSLMEMASRIVMQKGIPHLMEAHIQKYACPECGGIISLHDKVCTECGKERK